MGSGEGLVALLKRSKTNGRRAGSIPQPVSLTSTRKPSRWHRATTLIEPPGGVNLTEFDSRFQNTWRSRSGSPDIVDTSGATSTRNRTFLACAANCTVSAASLRIVLRSMRQTSRRRLPRTIREMSTRSLTTTACARAPRSSESSAFPMRVCVHPPAFQELNPSHDSGHRRPQFVRQRREELVFCAVGRVRRRTRLLLPTQQGLALRFYRLPLADVSKRPNHTLDFLILVADIREALLDGTPAPILPDQHVLADHAVLRQRVRGRVRRITGGDRLQPRVRRRRAVPAPRRRSNR